MACRTVTCRYTTGAATNALLQTEGVGARNELMRERLAESGIVLS
jgi:hypothetical protein